MSIHRFVSTARNQSLRHTALALAIAAGVTLAGPAAAQSSTGAIFGTAPAGDSVLIQNDGGVSREVSVDANGRYTAGSLPLGSYTVSLKKDGAVVDSRSKVSLTVGAGTQVSFAATAAAEAKSLGAVTVMANALPAIDVSQMDTRTVITADDLSRLPVARSAEAIAILAPGVNTGSSYFTGPTGQTLVSFGGSSIAENAYYINGFNTTDVLHNFGGITLPYGAIDQQQMLTGGYGAAYGRSDGGVINQVGKRGTNDWHFGAQVVWQPKFGESDPDNGFYPTGPQFLSNSAGGRQGQIYQFRNDNKSWERAEDFYFGGPLIKDTLYIFGAVEDNHINDGVNVASRSTLTQTNYSYDRPKYYGKIDWNINDSNILEFTGVSNKSMYSGNTYKYTYAPPATQGTQGAFLGPATYTKGGADLWTTKYTGYITDDLTVEALYGKMNQINYSRAAGGSEAYVVSAANQDPTMLPAGSSGITGPQINETVDDPNARDKTSNLRLDVNYKIGTHSITAGIDNLDLNSMDIGTTPSGPGYYWVYYHGAPTAPISSLPGESVGAPGGNGYYVAKTIYSNAASARVKQRAQFIEDAWQVTDRVLLNLGIRNDQFTNYNPDGIPYLRLTKPQWAPRIGASWDVYGDSSLKVYGNAGRYYLAEPANVAIRGAAGSTYTSQYFTYTGIDASTGAPTGLTQIPQDRYPGVSANNEFGVPPDPKTVTSANAKAEYQDEYIAGFDKTLDMFDQHWVWGAKGTYRVLRNDLDDVCDDNTIMNYAAAQGLDPVAALGSTGCYIMNPGRTANINVSNGAGGYSTLTIPWSAWGMPTLLRKYVAANFYLEHPFDGKWYGRIDYVWSHNFGNTEGSVRSDIGQTDVSQTEDWDNAGVMTYANGDLANDRRHQLKMVGYYQITSEWLVGGNAQILSGTPKMCLGYFGSTQDDPFGYAAAYHFCGPSGTPAAPGSTGRTPWQEIFSLNAEYRPNWAGKKLAFDVMVYNIFDKQVITQYYQTSESGPSTLSSRWQTPISWTTPRYVRFSVSYDF
ncbi:Oar protein [Dyella solisilvae]|uniref:Oar protein n=1 Tax=Dyella solisilvae TaxID=1920168 RepID=A0A370K7F8_9GAMM|nr:TonB-dependent receptor [Dyella solisilvae]RDI98588.1 Oar protein [Dyella solisilvae]